MDIRRQVGTNMRRLRKERGWSQEELAFECGVHRTYISGIERGVHSVAERGIDEDEGRTRLTFRYRAHSWTVVVKPDGSLNESRPRTFTTA
jgi:transcriptional regulator with XRE-family HTH domain